MLGVITATIVAAAGALWIYVGRERLGVAGAGLAALRTAAVAGLALLLLNPVGAAPDGAQAPVVLLDASLSMGSAGGQWADAVDIARNLAGTRGTILRFGDEPAVFDTAPPGAPASRLQPALAQAAAMGGPVSVVTDGEVSDGAAIPPALRAIATMIVLPRDSMDDVALIDVDVPDRLTAGDTLWARITLAVHGRPGDSAVVSVREGGRRLATATVALPGRTARVALPVAPATLDAGVHALTVAVATPGDREPRTDTRLRLVEVTALPSLVLVAAPASWEATFLARELRDVARAPVGAYGQITADRWIDLATQRPVSAARVTAAVVGARLVVRLGSPGVPEGRGPVWRWPQAPERALAGEWYPGEPAPSPLAARLAGVPWDSLPPLSGVQPIAPAPDAWIGLSARLARRGAERPILVGEDRTGRRVLLTAGQGLWRWALRGGVAREAYRGLVAAGVDWLLGGAAVRDHALVLARPVVARGEPLVFRWVAMPAPDSLAIHLTPDDTTLSAVAAVLRFDAQGEARVHLPPGVWRWRTARPARRGTAGVESYSPEYVAAPASVASAPATSGAGMRLAGLRDRWWLYLLLIGVLLGEWWWRMRKGLA